MRRGDGVGAAPREPRPRTDTRRASRRRYGAAMASLWSREPRPRRDATEPSATARPRRPTRARLRRSARGLRPRREQTRVESVAATAWGPDAVDAAERPRERAPPGTLRRGPASGALGRGRREAGGRGRRGERANAEHGKDDGKKPQKNTHRSSTSTAARSSRSARRRSSSSAGRRRACCCAPTSPRAA